MRLKLLIALGALMSTTACATVLRGPNVELKVATEPPGATVTTSYLTNATRGELTRERKQDRIYGTDRVDSVPLVYASCAPTPCAVEVSRRANFTATITLEGYHPATVEITSGFGQGGGTSAVAGAAASATGAYLVTYGMASAVATIGTLGFASSATVASYAGSAATSAATGMGVIFLGVDVATGAMLDVRPNPLILILVPEDEPLPDADTLLIENLEQLELVLADRQEPDLAAPEIPTEPAEPEQDAGA